MSTQNSQDRRARRRDTHFPRRKLIDEILRSYNPDGGWANYWRVIDTVRSRTDLLSPRRSRCGQSGFRRVARACERLARHTNCWVRQPEFWLGTKSNSPHEQWGEFVGHLLHLYDAPKFLAPMWLKSSVPEWHKELHFHLGEGSSLRKYDLPGLGRVSKSNARWFMQAPVHANVDGALRWAQIRTLGGEPALAGFLMNRFPMCADEGWEDWVKGLFEFMVKNQRLCKDDILEIAQFAINQRFEPASKTVGLWMGEAPVDPDFNLRSWSLRRLRRHMVSWRESMPMATDYKKIGWEQSRYQPYEEALAGVDWKIVELCTPRALRIEGQRMNHCIATYESLCRRKRSSIWSLRRSLPDGRVRSVVTIEIDPSRNEIREMNGKANSEPEALPLKVLDAWASREGLSRE